MIGIGPNHCHPMPHLPNYRQLYQGLQVGVAGACKNQMLSFGHFHLALQLTSYKYEYTCKMKTGNCRERPNRQPMTSVQP